MVGEEGRVSSTGTGEAKGSESVVVVYVCACGDGVVTVSTRFSCGFFEETLMFPTEAVTLAATCSCLGDAMSLSGKS